MPNTCKVCRHPKVNEIDEAVLAGVAFRDIARRFRLTHASVHRHQKHLSETLQKAHAAEEVSRADSLVEQLQTLQEDARRISGKAEKSREYHAALAGVRELTRLLQVAMKIGEQAIAESNSGDMSPTKQKLYRHAARAMCAAFGLDDRIVLVVTEGQAAEMTEQLRQIFGLKLKPEEAISCVNKGLALIDESDPEALQRPGAPNPPVGRRF